MVKKENLAIDFGGKRLFVENDTTFLLQIVIGPDVMVADEEMHLHPIISQFGEFAEKAAVTSWHHIFVFIPEIEHVAQKINGSRLMLDAVEKAHQTALVHAAMVDGP